MSRRDLKRCVYSGTLRLVVSACARWPVGYVKKERTLRTLHQTMKDDVDKRNAFYSLHEPRVDVNGGLSLCKCDALPEEDVALAVDVLPVECGGLSRGEGGHCRSPLLAPKAPRHLTKLFDPTSTLVDAWGCEEVSEEVASTSEHVCIVPPPRSGQHLSSFHAMHQRQGRSIRS